MSNEIKKYDEYIFKDGEYRQVAGAQNGLRKSGKFITVSKRNQSFYYPPDDVDYYFQMLRLTFIGFSKADVGRKIFLYKLKSKKPERLTHPRDCYDESNTKIAQLGCGVFYNKDDEEYVYHHIYQTNQGLAQTEWTITNEDIENGYIEINMSEWLVNMIFPMGGEHWNQCKFIGGNHYWFALENDIKTLSEEIIIGELRTYDGNGSLFWLKLDDEDQLLFMNNRYYLIKGYWNSFNEWGNELKTCNIPIRINQ